MDRKPMRRKEVVRSQERAVVGVVVGYVAAEELRKKRGNPKSDAQTLGLLAMVWDGMFEGKAKDFCRNCFMSKRYDIQSDVGPNLCTTPIKQLIECIEKFISRNREI